MVEEPVAMSQPCTKFDFRLLDKDYLLYLAIVEVEGAAEEAQRRGLGHLLPQVAR